MPKQLSPEDRRAVDLVLDRDSVGASAMYASVTNGMGQRMERVERLLSLLGEMEAGDPPADLARRTLDRIHEQQARVHAPVRAPAADQTRPHA